MELGLYPKRQRWHIERFIPHGWPWGERSRQITPEPEVPWGLSIWGKLLLVAANEDIFHVTGQWRATDQHWLDCSSLTWHVSLKRCCNVKLECARQRRKKEYTHLHADVNIISFISVLRPRLHADASQKIRINIRFITREAKHVKPFLF